MKNVLLITSSPRGEASHSTTVATDFVNRLGANVIHRELWRNPTLPIGPAFVHAKVTRPYSHSLSDDEKLYRIPEEIEADAATDPIKKFAELLMTDGLASSEQLEKLRKEVDAEVTKASDIAIETPQPAAETALRTRIAQRQGLATLVDVRA